jgi:hypothetical protein
VDGGKEIACGFVVARCDCSELFEFTEEILDQVALLVELWVEFAWRQAIWSRRDYGRFPSCRQRFEHPAIGIIGSVGDQQIGLHMRQQCISAGQVVRLPWGQQKAQRIAEGIDQGVDFGGQSAARSADRLLAVFFRAPALCW